MTRVTRSSIILAVASIGMVGAAGYQTSPPPRMALPVPSTLGRVMQMLHHFSAVMDSHEAVIRGDMRAVHEAGLRVALVTMPAGMPERTAPFVANIRAAGQRAAETKTIEAAARATVDMVTACADCHQAVGVYPSPIVSTPRDLGGLVGHMEQHQRAADDMLLGLMIPSPSQWRDGADRLFAAPLLPSDLPNDRQLTDQIRKADKRIHELAARASTAQSPRDRGEIYTQVIANCSQCHSLHSRIWGPTRGGERP